MNISLRNYKEIASLVKDINNEAYEGIINMFEKGNINAINLWIVDQNKITEALIELYNSYNRLKFNKELCVDLNDIDGDLD